MKFADIAIQILGRKFAEANANGDVAAQTANLKKIATISHNVQKKGYSKGANISGEVHWNGNQPNSRQAHIEYLDGREGRLIPNKCDGIKSHLQDADGDWICDWSSDGYFTTLDQKINHVPAWLGGTIEAEVLNNSDLISLISSVIA